MLLDKNTIESEEQNLLISIDCANIGERTGEEITQVYVGYADESDWKRAPKELKVFHRTRLISAGEKNSNCNLFLPLGMR